MSSTILRLPFFLLAVLATIILSAKAQSPLVQSQKEIPVGTKFFARKTLKSFFWVAECGVSSV